jgi:hypothetical protein
VIPPERVTVVPHEYDHDAFMAAYERMTAGAKPEHAEAGAEIARAALERLNYPSEVTDRVVRIVRHHMTTAMGSKKPAKIRRWRAQVGPDLIPDLLLHRRADMGAKGDSDGVAGGSDDLDRFASLLAQEQDAPWRRSDLAITGGDLVAAGVKPGPELGGILNDLLAKVIADPAANRRETLLKLAGVWDRAVEESFLRVVSVDGPRAVAERVAQALGGVLVEDSLLEEAVGDGGIFVVRGEAAWPTTYHVTVDTDDETLAVQRALGVVARGERERM